MIKKIYFLALSIICSIILHAYLTNSYYQIHYGEGVSGSSICNVGQKFNCEAVSASGYSQFMGIPLAVWGLGLNLALLILLLGYLITDEFKKQWWAGFQTLIVASAIGSIIMGLVSLSLLSVYCLFCIILYVFSFVQLYLSFKVVPVSELKDYFAQLFNFSKIPYAVFIAILMFPLISLFVSAKMKRDFGGDRFEKQLDSLLSDWKQETNVIQFANTPGTLVKPAKNPETKFEIVEFADFLCGHCQKASRTIKTFLANHDANFRFYTFPLDQTCRSVENKLTGPSCFLAKTAYCAEKQGLGWKVHDWIFDNQKDLFVSLDKIKLKIKSELSNLGLAEAEWISCTESEETHQAIVNQSQFAQNLNITGTPTIYVNGKKLRGGQVLDVLKRAYKMQ